MDKKKAVVIIPHYNRWDLTHARIWELYKHEKDNIKYVLIINNGSTDSQTGGGLRWWADFRVKTDFDVRVVNIEENVGFLRACNVGLDFVKSEEDELDTPVVLLSNDVIIYGKFLDQIINTVSNVKSLVGGILYTQDTGWNSFGSQVFSYIEGWLLATTLQNWVELGGGFDERFIPNDFEDIDLSTTALSLGYELIPLNNINLKHLGGQTISYGEEREQITKTNREKFRKKWIDKNE